MPAFRELTPKVEVTTDRMGMPIKVAIDGVEFTHLSEISWKWKANSPPAIVLTVHGNLIVNGEPLFKEPDFERN